MYMSVGTCHNCQLDLVISSFVMIISVSSLDGLCTDDLSRFVAEVRRADGEAYPSS